MLLVAIDTAGPDCAVAVARSQSGALEILARTSERLGRGHAERLMPMVQAMLSQAKVAFADIDRVAVTTGPGSFTGVRVGVAAARGLALALEIEAVGIGSLEALAFPVLETQHAGTLLAVLDARRDEVYALVQDLASKATLVEAAAFRAEDIVERISPLRRPLFVTGAGVPLVASVLGRSTFNIAGMLESPDIADVAALGARAEVGSLPVPLYARGTDAKPQASKALPRK